MYKVLCLQGALALLSAFLIQGTLGTPCGLNQFEFLSRCFCKIGFDPRGDESDKGAGGDAAPKPTLMCDVPVGSIGGCPCPEDQLHLNNATWYWNGDTSERGIRCTNLCRSNNQIGVPYSIPVEWSDNNNWKQIGFYKKELTIASERRRHNHLIERLDEFAEGFASWGWLNGSHLGTVMEFGAGGYTQTRNILERTKGVTLSSVALLDPQINSYRQIKSCSFESGNLTIRPHPQSTVQAETSWPTQLVESTVEEYGQRRDRKVFDTVISMNVLVYAKNATAFLQTLHDSLRQGGLLLFHDRWFDAPAHSSRCKMSGFLVNVLQVKRPLLDHFLAQYTWQYYSTNQTAGQAFRQREWCRHDHERGYFVGGIKK